jgi:hypothetical protein
LRLSQLFSRPATEGVPTRHVSQPNP